MKKLAVTLFIVILLSLSTLPALAQEGGRCRNCHPPTPRPCTNCHPYPGPYTPVLVPHRPR